MAEGLFSKAPNDVREARSEAATRAKHEEILIRISEDFSADPFTFKEIDELFNGNLKDDTEKQCTEHDLKAMCEAGLLDYDEEEKTYMISEQGGQSLTEQELDEAA